MTKIKSFFRDHKFNIVSWSLTFVLVAGIAFGGFAWKRSTTTVQALQPEPTSAPDAKQPDVQMPALGESAASFSIARSIELKTNSPADKPRYNVEDYRVARGDSVFAIAESFKLKPETV